jgi:hypothetical protein
VTAGGDREWLTTRVGVVICGHDRASFPSFNGRQVTPNMRHLSLVELHAAPAPTRIEPDPGDPTAELADRLSVLGKDVSVEQAVEVGRLVIERLYDGDLSAWRGRGPKAHSLRTLARRADLTVSSSALYRSIALYELSERLGGIERWAAAGLGVSHVRLVLGLEHEDQRRLLDLAVEQAWTVAELEREAAAARARGPKRENRGGRPRLPRFLKSIHRIRKASEVDEEMYGDLDAIAEMQPEQITEIRDMLASIRARCDELDRQLQDALV